MGRMTRDEKRRAMYAVYLQGVSMVQIGKFFRVSRTTVARMFIEKGLKTRPKIVTVGDPKNPKIGDIVSSSQVNKRHRGRYIYMRCPECGSGHWVRLEAYKGDCLGYCRKHYGIAIGRANTGGKRSEATKKLLGDQKRGAKNHWWRGGKFKNHEYIALYLSPDHPLFEMTVAHGRVFEHRIVMANQLGRPLRDEEVVHHINGIKTDNRIENLRLFANQSEHMIIHNGGEIVEVH